MVSKNKAIFVITLIVSIVAISALFQLSTSKSQSNLASAKAAEETCNWVRTCSLSVEVDGEGIGREAARSQAMSLCAAEVQNRLQNGFLNCYRNAVTACVSPCYTGIEPRTISVCQITSCEVIPYERRNPANPLMDYKCTAEAYGSAKITCALPDTHNLY